MIFYYVFMILLMINSVYNVELGFFSVYGNNVIMLFKDFVYGFWWVFFGVGVFYGLIVSCLLIVKFCKMNMMDYFIYNLEYIILMMILVIIMIIDVMWFIVEDNDNIFIIIVLIFGWWLNVFFLFLF